MKYDQTYLENLITNKVEESLHLDYKSAAALERNDKKTAEISKDVSAFANSDGGIIIYGMKEDTVNKHLPGSFDPIDRKKISKEWLEQIIISKIQPKLGNVVITPIQINDSVDDVVYVVEIPKGSTAHQAEDKRYYKRYNFMSVPMHDYEIRDIINRVKLPKIELNFRIIRLGNTEKGYRYFLKAYALNIGSVLAKYVIGEFSFIGNCLIKEFSTINPATAIRKFSGDNTIQDVLDLTGLHPKYGPSRYNPLLPTRRIKLDTEEIELHEFYNDSSPLIEWVVYADNSEPQLGSTSFGEIQVERM